MTRKQSQSTRGYIRLGTAGWTIPRAVQPAFAEGGTHLARYARVLSGAEINSSFYRSHKRQTYERWASSVAPNFRFSVKIPKLITHELRLVNTGSVLDGFLAEIAGLGSNLGCLLLQLPPKFEFNEAVAGSFFQDFRARYPGAAVIEPRHPTWFSPEARALLSAHVISRVAADPAVVADAANPGVCGRLAYFRWHGSPRVYFSPYADAALQSLAATVQQLSEQQVDTWCIFDNTASGAALSDALKLMAFLSEYPASAANP